MLLNEGLGIETCVLFDLEYGLVIPNSLIPALEVPLLLPEQLPSWLHNPV